MKDALYEYETSPRKVKPKHQKSKRDKKDIEKEIRKRNEEQRKHALKLERKKQNKNVVMIVFIFIILLVISYRSSLINERFNEIQEAKEELLGIEKTNGQLEVSIESDLNLSNIEQVAKEMLGMQRLDNSQKVYVTLDKKDYVEGKSEEVEIIDEEDLPWYKKIINKIFGN